MLLKVLILTMLALFEVHAQLKEFVPCKAPSSVELEVRDLHVATCDSREGWKEFMALRTWNATGYPLHTIDASTNDATLNPQGSIPMTNVCKAHKWEGFLTKPLLYLEWIKSLPIKSARGGENHVILMDSDTFWSPSNTNDIWKKYDCARNNKDILMSTEMSCWVGRYCTDEDIQKYYNNTGSTPSYSPFLNSGVVMGTVTSIRSMLEYVITNNSTYFIKHVKTKFDDQFAYTDYAFKVNPDNVALDYHQQLFASFSIHAPGDPHEEGWPFACRSLDTDDRWANHVCPSCPNWTKLLNKQGFWQFEENSCKVYRKTWDKMPLEKELKTLATDPIIWHGNGAGKWSFYHYAHESYICALRKRDLTQKYYEEHFCCD
jgi:hypothetical protein